MRWHAVRSAPSVLANTAGYTALNLDPGRSNEARVVVEGTSILPVTGGLLVGFTSN